MPLTRTFAVGGWLRGGAVCYGPPLVSTGRTSRGARLRAAAVLLSLSAVPLLAGNAASEESLGDLEARVAEIQAELDATTAKVEALHAREEALETELVRLKDRIAELEADQRRLQRKVVARADAIYRAGSSSMVEALFRAGDFGELQARAEILSQVSLEDSGAFVAMARSRAELEDLSAEVAEKEQDLAATSRDLQAEARKLQQQFEDAAAELRALRAKLAAASAAPARPAAPISAPASAPAPSVSGKACPVGQPHSFVDSWGAPRSGGRSHEGVDIMANYGTPVYAITSGTITYAGYGDSAGNWQILAGSDGNQYWYMHNQTNVVTGGSVSAGQQIATVGDTGNATGVPHLHFEYHPGGGAPVNPYPLVASIC